MQVKPNTWYAVTLKEQLGVLAAGAKAWVKANTERPLKLGPTYWVYQPKAGIVVHVVSDVLGRDIRFALNGNTLLVADARQKKVLDAAFSPLVTKIVKGWDKQTRVAQKLGILR